MKKQTIAVLAVALSLVGLIVLAWLLGNYMGQKKILDSYKDTADTVTKYVTVYKDHPDPVKTVSRGFVSVPMYKFIMDTVHKNSTIVLHDTTTQIVYLPREEKKYSEMEGKLRIWISGYEPRLDKWEFDAPEVTITKTVYTRPSRWSFSISAGWGFTYGVFNKKLDMGPTVVVGGSYSF